MPLPRDVVEEIIRKANEVKNTTTGESLGKVLEPIIRVCGESANNIHEFIECIEDALDELKRIAKQVKV